MNPENYPTFFPQSFSSSSSSDPCTFATDPFSIFSSSPAAAALPPSSADYFPMDPSLFLPSLCSLEHGDSSAPAKRLRLLSPHGPASKHPNDSARTRRHKFGDRTRSLQKLLPWTKKMDTATVLEDAAKYVRFLQSQVAVLEAMPISSSFGQIEGSSSAIVGPLGSLNRQQTLQVLLNSPVAQTSLSDLGLCVFSYEQLVMLRKVPALPPPFNNFNH